MLARLKLSALLSSLVMVGVAASGCGASATPKGAADTETGPGEATSQPVAASAKPPAEEPPAYDCLQRPASVAEVTTPKKDAINTLMEDEWVNVFLDPRARGAVLPEYLTKLPYLMLQIGNDMPVPIEELRVEESSFSGKLSFHREPFAVKVPYAAVFAVVGVKSGRGLYWLADAPADAFCTK